MRCNSLLIRYFNSQPRKEADENDFEDESKTENFNSQPRKEADRKQRICGLRIQFQFTASQGG